jgi:hypothetical protein
VLAAEGAEDGCSGLICPDRFEPTDPPPSCFRGFSRGGALTIARCIEISGCKVIRVPGQWACQLGLGLTWRFGISAIPPEITPYMTGAIHHPASGVPRQ